MTNICKSADSKPTPGHQDYSSLYSVGAGSKMPRYVVTDYSRSSQRFGGDLLGFARNDVARLSKLRFAHVLSTSGDMYVTNGGMSLRATLGIHIKWLRQYVRVPV